MPRSATELAKAFDALQQRCRTSSTADGPALLEHARALGHEVRESIAAHVAPTPVEIARASTKDLYYGGGPLHDGAVVLWDRGRFRYMPGIVLRAGQFRATVHLVDDVCDGLHRLDFLGHARRLLALAQAFTWVALSPEVTPHGAIVARMREVANESRELAAACMQHAAMLDPHDVVADPNGGGVVLTSLLTENTQRGRAHRISQRLQSLLDERSTACPRE